MLDLAVIGAGVSGLAAAIELRDHQVAIFEKSRGFGGRAATRLVGGIAIDHGANYLTLESADIRDWFGKRLQGLPLQEIRGDIWVFDQSGQLKPGDPTRDSATKLTLPDGINQLGRALAAACPHPIHRETHVGKLIHQGDCWSIVDDSGAELTQARAVLVSVPLAQAIDLFSSEIMPSSCAIPEYHRQFSVMFAFDQKLELAGDFYAAINTDQSHSIAWFSREDCKPGRVPADRSAWVVQLSPQWTAENFEMERDEVAKFAHRQLESLLGCRLPQPAAHSVQRWKFAHPKEAAPVPLVEDLRRKGIFLCGDGLVGKGRIGKSILTGIHAARAIENV